MRASLQWVLVVVVEPMEKKPLTRRASCVDHIQMSDGPKPALVASTGRLFAAGEKGNAPVHFTSVSNGIPRHLLSMSSAFNQVFLGPRIMGITIHRLGLFRGQSRWPPAADRVARAARNSHEGVLGLVAANDHHCVNRDFSPKVMLEEWSRVGVLHDEIPQCIAYAACNVLMF